MLGSGGGAGLFPGVGIAGAFAFVGTAFGGGPTGAHWGLLELLLGPLVPYEFVYIHIERYICVCVGAPT